MENITCLSLLGRITYRQVILKGVALFIKYNSLLLMIYMTIYILNKWDTFVCVYTQYGVRNSIKVLFSIFYGPI